MVLGSCRHYGRANNRRCPTALPGQDCGSTEAACVDSPCGHGQLWAVFLLTPFALSSRVFADFPVDSDLLVKSPLYFVE